MTPEERAAARAWLAKNQGIRSIPLAMTLDALDAADEEAARLKARIAELEKEVDRLRGVVRVVDKQRGENLDALDASNARCAGLEAAHRRVLNRHRRNARDGVDSDPVDECRCVTCQIIRSALAETT